MTIHNIPNNQLPFRNSRSIENEKRTKRRIIALRDAHLRKISKNIRNSTLDKFAEDINISINQGNLKSTKLLYAQFLRDVMDNTNKNQSNREILRELADKITISLTDGKFDGTKKKNNDELMEISRKMYVDAPENKAKFTDNKTITAISTKTPPLSEIEKMKRVNSLLINAGANSGSASKGTWKWPTRTVAFLKDKELLFVPLGITIPEEIEANLIKNINKRGSASFNTLTIVKWLYDLQQLQENLITTSQSNSSKARLNILESATGVRTRVRPRINIDWDALSKKLRIKGIINVKGNPGSLSNLRAASNYQIVQYFNSLAHGLLSSYRCADDFNKLKGWINWFIRYSLVSTLKDKLKLPSRSAVFDRFGTDISTVNSQGKKINFITTNYIFSLQKEFLRNLNKDGHIDTLLKKSFVSLTKENIFFKKCAICGCSNTDIEIHHVRQLYRNVDNNNRVIVKGRVKFLKGWKAVLSAINRKQITLCKKHLNDLHANKLLPNDFDNQWLS